MPHPSPPNGRELLPPILACLPAAFAPSSPPPPALMPLLCPVLRQRINFLAGGGPNVPQRKEGWLPLMSWDAKRGSKLPGAISSLHLEPHPVSGVVECDIVRAPQYRRLDEETLQAHIEVVQFALSAIFVWVEQDETDSSAKPGWRLTELHTTDDHDRTIKWHESIWQANAAQEEQNAISYANSKQPLVLPVLDEDDEDDSSYWARYDMTPGVELAKKATQQFTSRKGLRSTGLEQVPEEDDYFGGFGQTPGGSGLAKRQSYLQARRASRAAALEKQLEEEYFSRYDMTPGAEIPKKGSFPWVARKSRPADTDRQVEDDYFSRYGLEVQPALDAHDPDEEREDIGPSTLGGTAILTLTKTISIPNGKSMFPADPTPRPVYSRYVSYFPPQPIAQFAADSRGSSIDTLEDEAAAMAQVEALATQEPDLALRAIKQHISTDIKSLFRLARGAGMDREDFIDVVRRQLDSLVLFERDD